MTTPLLIMTKAIPLVTGPANAHAVRELLSESVSARGFAVRLEAACPVVCLLLLLLAEMPAPLRQRPCKEQLRSPTTQSSSRDMIPRSSAGTVASSCKPFPCVPQLIAGFHLQQMHGCKWYWRSF